MRRILRSSVFFLVPFLALSFGAHSDARADSLILKNGEEVQGKIRKETINELVIQSNGTRTRTIPRREIVVNSVTHDDEPRDLVNGRAALRQRDYVNARRRFKAMIDAIGSTDGGGTPPPAIFLQHAIYGMVQSCHGEGKTTETIQYIDHLISTDSTSWYLQDALLLKLRLLIAGGSASESSFEDALQKAKGAPAGVAGRIGLLRGDYLLGNNKTSEAQTQYKGLSRNTDKLVAHMAGLKLAQLQLAGGDTVSAKIAFNSLLRESRSQAILCGAARGLGDTQMKEISDFTNVESYREVLDSYLKAVVLYFPGQGDPTEPYQDALLSAGNCARKLLDLSKGDPKVSASYRRVAQDLYSDLRRDYPGTRQAQEADQAMNELAAN